MTGLAAATPCTVCALQRGGLRRAATGPAGQPRAARVPGHRLQPPGGEGARGDGNQAWQQPRGSQPPLAGAAESPATRVPRCGVFRSRWQPAPSAAHPSACHLFLSVVRAPPPPPPGHGRRTCVWAPPAWRCSTCGTAGTCGRCSSARGQAARRLPPAPTARSRASRQGQRWALPPCFGSFGAALMPGPAGQCCMYLRACRAGLLGQVLAC